ncbi:MAG TPA: hypothetical protein VKR24_01170 [Candidatus Limnocylindrales bacterium]|nr:hypothetical protein [Candidatus Limnocylindrales bacterium]
MARPETEYVTPRQLVLAVLCLLFLVVAFCGAVAVGWASIGTPTP